MSTNLVDLCKIQYNVSVDFMLIDEFMFDTYALIYGGVIRGGSIQILKHPNQKLIIKNMPRERFELSFLDFKSSVLTVELSGLEIKTIYFLLSILICVIIAICAAVGAIIMSYNNGQKIDEIKQLITLLR